MVFRQLMMVEIVERGVMDVPDIDDRDGAVREVSGNGLTPHDAHRVNGEEHAACEEFVLMRAAGVGENRGERRHQGTTLRRHAGLSNGADSQRPADIEIITY